MEENEIEALLERDMDQLLLDLDIEVGGRGLKLDTRSIATRISEARDWLKRHTTIVQEAVCGLEIVQRSLDDKKAVSRTELIAALADALTMYFTGLAPWLVATIIYKQGLSLICPPREKQT